MNRSLCTGILLFTCVLAAEEFTFDSTEGLPSLKKRTEFRLEAKSGRNFTTALRTERKDPKSYQLYTIPVLAVPGKYYRAEVWVKTDKVSISPEGGGATVCIEFLKRENGKTKWMTGRYLRGITGTRDWTRLSETIRIPDNAVKTILSLYLWKGSTGTAWFDDLRFTEVSRDPWQCSLIAPFGTVSGSLTLTILENGDLPAAGRIQSLELFIPEKRRRLRTVRITHPAVIPLGKLQDGKYTAEVTARGPDGKKLFVRTLAFQIEKKRRKRTVGIDHLGHTLVNGKPFLPLGFYTGTIKEPHLRKLREGGFNCIMPYALIKLKPEIIRKKLDLAAKYGIKVIFSVKDIGSTQRYGLQQWQGTAGPEAILNRVIPLFKDHPALLAWYINDEQPFSQIPRLEKMRRQINHLDPDHPTWSVLYQFNDLPLYSGTTDIIGIDPYPLPCTDLSLVRKALVQSAKTGLPLWAVPQASHFKFRRFKENPSESQYRTLVLYEMQNGAKGFIFYMFEDLYNPKLPKNNLEKEWPKFVRIASLITKLTPFILSGKPQELLLRKGSVDIVRLTDGNGRKAIIAVNSGPGPGNAEFSAEGNFRQAAGNFVRTGAGWKFISHGVDSAVMIEPE